MPSIPTALALLTLSAGAAEPPPDTATAVPPGLRAGVQVAVGIEDYNEFGLGTHGSFAVGDSYEVLGGVTWYLSELEEVSFWEGHVVATYWFPMDGMIVPYTGLGPTYSNLSAEGVFGLASRREWGLALLLGGAVTVDPTLVRAEVRYITGSDDHFVVSAGVSFPLTGS